MSAKALKTGVSLGSVSFGSAALSTASHERCRREAESRDGGSEFERADASGAPRRGGGGFVLGKAALELLGRRAARAPRGDQGGAGGDARRRGGDARAGRRRVRHARARTRATGRSTARTAQLQSLVGDLAQQVHAVSRTISGMSDAQRTFQERSQRTILGHLEQAQARIADQVARAVAAAGGDSARLSTGTRPSAMAAGGGLGITESDPPPRYGGRPPSGGGAYGRDGDGRGRASTPRHERRSTGGSRRRSTGGSRRCSGGR